MAETTTAEKLGSRTFMVRHPWDKGPRPGVAAPRRAPAGCTGADVAPRAALPRVRRELGGGDRIPLKHRTLRRGSQTARAGRGEEFGKKSEKVARRLSARLAGRVRNGTYTPRTRPVGAARRTAPAALH